jgi:putative flippase GtrA
VGQPSKILSLFARYTSIGLINTLIHWLVFAALYTLGASQLLANSAAFCVAVTFSFFANARWTFHAKATSLRYILFVLFMGAMAATIGWAADKMHTSPLITLAAFSFISLIAGFVYSNFIVFRVKK